MQPNILYIGPFPPAIGGATRSLHIILSTIANQGARIRVVSPITPEHRRLGDPTASGLRNIEVTRFEAHRFTYASSFPGHDVDAFRYALRREHREIAGLMPALVAAESPDVVLVGHEKYASFIPEIVRESKLPYVQLLRGDPTWRIVCDTIPDREKRRWVERFALADAVVPVAKYFEDGLKRLGLHNVSAIPNVVDTDVFSPGRADPSLRNRLQIRSDDTVILHASKFHDRKRPLDIVEAAGEALQSAPELLFLMIGDGPLRAEVEQRCQKKGLADRFRFTGMKDYSSMPAYYRLADMVVMPSEGEGIARVYLETQASAKVIIASDIPAAREVIDDGESGVLFPKGDARALAEKMVWLARDAFRRRAIGQAGRQRLSRHRPGQVAAAYISLLESVIATHARGVSKPT